MRKEIRERSEEEGGWERKKKGRRVTGSEQREGMRERQRETETLLHELIFKIFAIIRSWLGQSQEAGIPFGSSS